MDKKKLFINWVSSNKLKHVSPDKFADLLEDVFLSYLNRSIWDISNSIDFSTCRKELLLDKTFKKKAKEAYKLFVRYGKFYQLFLKFNNNFETKNSDEKSDELDNFSNIADIDSDAIVEKDDNSRQQIDYKDEYVKIVGFFNDEMKANTFYKMFDYAKKKLADFELDVRTTIIGVKLKDERLRFYSDKNGQLKFSKLSSETISIDSAALDIKKIYCLIDRVNDYFLNNKDEVSLVKSEQVDTSKNIIGYIYHKKYGFGVIKAEEDRGNNTVYVIGFTDFPNEEKIIVKGHSSCVEISEKEYIQKKKPVFSNVSTESLMKATPIEKPTEKSNNESCDVAIDFNRLPDLSFTNPTYFAYKNNLQTNITSWTELYRYVLKALYVQHIDVFDEMVRNFTNTFFSARPTSLRRATKISNKCYAEANRSTNDLVKSIKSILDKCNVSYNEIIIRYTKKDNSKPIKTKKEYSIDISEADFYTYIKEAYEIKHRDDKKALRASHHAQVCLNLIGCIKELTSIDLYNNHSKKEFREIYDIIESESRKNNIDEKTYKWFIYVLKRYQAFLGNGVDKVEKEIDRYNETKIDASDYKKVIEEVFPEGYAFNNQLRRRKFKLKYEELNGFAFTDSDDMYLKKLKAIGFIYEDKLYLETIISSELKDKIKIFINDSLNNCMSMIYFTSIYDVFSDKLDSAFNGDMFGAYLTFVFSSEYKFNKDYLCAKGGHVDLRQELINVFKQCGHPLDIEEIYSKFPNVSQSAINEIIKDRDFVVNYRGKSYFYRELFTIDNDDLENIEGFIRNTINEKESVNGTELNAFIKKMTPNVIEMNPDVTDLGIKNIIKLKFEDKFRFKGDLICKKGENIDVKSLFTEFCKLHRTFTLTELEEFRKNINQRYISWDAVMKASIRINQNSFVRRDLIDFDIKRIDEAIANYCFRNYVSFNDIINFIEFPTMEYNWNNYILECYVFANSDKYKLVHAAFNDDRPVGAIVSKNSKIENFNDLLVGVIRDNKLFEREKAFTFLIENDYIRTKKVKNIDFLIDEAKKEA